MTKWLTLSVGLGIALLAGAAEAAPFVPGNLVVLGAPGVSNTGCSIVELNPTAANQTPVQTLTIDSSFRVSGSATSTGYLSHSNDRTLLTFNGVVSTNTTSNVNTLNPRSVATLDPTGAFTLQTSYIGSSGNQTRSATSLDNLSWFIADQGGIYTNNAIAADPAGNQRGIKAFAGVVYVGRASATIPPVSTIDSPTGGTITGLPGLPNGPANFQDFYLIQSGASGANYDVLYVLSASSNTAGTLEKFSLASGAWGSNGSFSTGFGGFGLAAAPLGGQAALFVTTGLGAQMNNQVLRLTDTAGYNQPISIAPSITTLAIAPFTTNFKGIDFAPQPLAAVPVPVLGSLASLLASGLLACGLLLRGLRNPGLT